MGTFQYIFVNVENSIKKEIRKNCFSKKKYPHVGNSMKREENFKY